MKDKDVIEGNKLIAEFMNLELLEWKHSTNGTDMMIWVDKTTKLSVTDNKHLFYHSSWDWQVPVAAKAMEQIRLIYLKNGGSKNNKELSILVEEWQKGAVNNDLNHAFKMLVNIVGAINFHNTQPNSNSNPPHPTK